MSLINYSVSENFKIAEFVSRKTLIRWGDRAVWFIDPRNFTFLEYNRTKFGPVTLNNWIEFPENYKGPGLFDSRGYRAPDDSEGAEFSQHRYGRASDSVYKNATPEEVREYIRKNWKAIYRPMGLTTIEKGVNWLHADFRWIQNQTQLFEVTP